MPARARGENLNGSGGVGRRISIGLAAPMAQINRKMKQKKKHLVSFCGKYEMNSFKIRKRWRELAKVFYKIFQKTHVHFA